MFNFSPSGGKFGWPFYWCRFHGELLANRPDRDWARASVTDSRFKPHVADLYKRRKNLEKKRKKGEDLKQHVHAQVSMHMCIHPDVVIYRVTGYSNC